MNCENEGCKNTAKYQLYNSEKKWINVCPECEEKISRQNLAQSRKQIYDLNSMRDSNPGKGKPTGEY